MCGAFYHLSLPDLQIYLSTLWTNLVNSSEQHNQGETIPNSPWIMGHDLISSIIHPSITAPGTVQTAYSNGVDLFILSNILKLIPTITGDYHKALLRTLRRGFVLRLMLDSRDISSGPCHNMLWTTSHFVSSICFISIGLLFYTLMVLGPLSRAT